MAPRILFEQELELLKTKVAEMSERAENSYYKLLAAVKHNDREIFTQLLDNDRHMVDMQRSIEAKCLTLLTRQQPVARDLRIVSAALKVVTDIERIGDQPDADKVVDFLMMAKYLEKIGDHGVNIAQWAIFQKTGDIEDVRLL